MKHKWTENGHVVGRCTKCKLGRTQVFASEPCAGLRPPTQVPNREPEVFRTLTDSDGMRYEAYDHRSDFGAFTEMLDRAKASYRVEPGSMTRHTHVVVLYVLSSATFRFSNDNGDLVSV